MYAIRFPFQTIKLGKLCHEFLTKENFIKFDDVLLPES